MQNFSIFDQVQFKESNHSYSIDEKKLIPVTQYISKFKPKFDRDKISKRVSEKTGKSVDLILKEWDEKSQKAMKKGLEVHEYVAKRLLGRLPDSLDSYPECQAFDLFWYNRNLLDPVKVEFKIGDKNYQLGGTIDCLMYNLKRNCYHVVDWKTGKFTLDNGWETMLSPFNSYDNSNFVNYSMQLACYELILRNNLDIELGPSKIVNLKDNWTYQIFDALNFHQIFKELLTN